MRSQSLNIVALLSYSTRTFVLPLFASGVEGNYLQLQSKK